MNGQGVEPVEHQAVETEEQTVTNDHPEGQGGSTRHEGSRQDEPKTPRDANSSDQDEVERSDDELSDQANSTNQTASSITSVTSVTSNSYLSEELTLKSIFRLILKLYNKMLWYMVLKRVNHEYRPTPSEGEQSTGEPESGHTSGSGTPEDTSHDDMPADIKRLICLIRQSRDLDGFKPESGQSTPEGQPDQTEQSDPSDEQDDLFKLIHRSLNGINRLSGLFE